MCILMVINKVILKRVVHIRQGTEVVSYPIKAMKKRDTVEKAIKTDNIEMINKVKQIANIIKRDN
jgi:hypothetical protein